MIPLIKVSKYLSSMDGVAIYPIITLLIFTGFFSIMFILTYKLDKKKLDQNSKLPLKENEYEHI